MDKIARQYIRSRVVWRLKDMKSNLRDMKRVAVFIKQNNEGLTKDQLVNVLNYGSSESEVLIDKLASLKKDLNKILSDNRRAL